MTPATLAALLDAQRQRQTVVLGKRLSDGLEFLLPDDRAPPAVNQAAQEALAQRRITTPIIAGEPWFIEARFPAPRLYLIGAVEIAQCLAPVAAMAGFTVHVIDPRRSFATAERFPGIDLIHDWPDTALDALRPDGESAIVTLTHNPKLDDPALEKALKAHAFYIGALGSRKTHAQRLERLREHGFTETELQRIRGPVGLKIGSVGASEIAISILAEIIAVRRHAELGTA